MRLIIINFRKDYGYLHSDITSSMVCATVDGGGKDSCQGDSGEGIGKY